MAIEPQSALNHVEPVSHLQYCLNAIQINKNNMVQLDIEERFLASRRLLVTGPEGAQIEQQFSQFRAQRDQMRKTITFLENLAKEYSKTPEPGSKLV